MAVSMTGIPFATFEIALLPDTERDEKCSEILCQSILPERLGLRTQTLLSFPGNFQPILVDGSDTIWVCCTASEGKKGLEKNGFL